MTMQDNWDEEGEVVQPAPVILPSPVGYPVAEVEESESEDNDESTSLSNLTDLSEDDREQVFGMGNMLDASHEGEDDLSDLLDVSSEDVMGEAPTPPEPPKSRYRIVNKGRRVIRRPAPPNAGLGGMRT